MDNLGTYYVLQVNMLKLIGQIVTNHDQLILLSTAIKEVENKHNIVDSPPETLRIIDEYYNKAMELCDSANDMEFYSLIEEEIKYILYEFPLTV